jgi:hypothetical protein
MDYSALTDKMAKAAEDEGEYCDCMGFGQDWDGVS